MQRNAFGLCAAADAHPLQKLHTLRAVPTLCRDLSGTQCGPPPLQVLEKRGRTSLTGPGAGPGRRGGCN